MRSFPAFARTKRLSRHPAVETNSGNQGTDMTGNTEVPTGNWWRLTTRAGVPVPSIVVINPPQEGFAQAIALVTAVLWLAAAWRTSRSAAR